MKRNPADRPAVLLRDAFGIRVNRLDPDEVAELVTVSVYVACVLKTNPRYSIEQFVTEATADDLDDAISSIGYRWGLATLPFLELLARNVKRGSS